MPLFEYTCPECGDSVDSLESYPPPASRPCDCGGEQERQFPAPAKTPIKWMGGATSVVKGSVAAPPPNAVNTRPIADGAMTTAAWRRNQKKRRAEKIRREVREAT